MPGHLYNAHGKCAVLGLAKHSFTVYLYVHFYSGQLSLKFSSILITAVELFLNLTQ